MTGHLLEADFVWKGQRPEGTNPNIFVLMLHLLYDASKLQNPGVDKFLMRLETPEDNPNFDADDPAIIIVPFDDMAQFSAYVMQLIACGLDIELFKA